MRRWSWKWSCTEVRKSCYISYESSVSYHHGLALFKRLKHPDSRHCSQTETSKVVRFEGTLRCLDELQSPKALGVHTQGLIEPCKLGCSLIPWFGVSCAMAMTCYDMLWPKVCILSLLFDQLWASQRFRDRNTSNGPAVVSTTHSNGNYTL